MNPEAGRDPRIRALAEALHQIRPAWNRTGITAALIAAAPNHPDLHTLFRVAIDAAFDASADTPAVIKTRDGAAWNAQKSDAPTQMPPPIDAVTPTVEAGDYEAGAAAARAAIRAAKEAAYAAKNPMPEIPITPPEGNK